MKNFTASFSIKWKSEDLQKSVPFMQQNWHKGFICSVAKKNPLITRIFLPNHFSQKMHERFTQILPQLFTKETCQNYIGK